MLRGADVNEIQQLHREGLSISQISALKDIDRKTVRKYLHAGAPQVPRYGPRPTRQSLLGPFVPYIQARLAAGVWNAVVLLGEIKERGYQGHYTLLCDYLRPLRQEARRVAVRRFETPPGQQAQVDWGVLGELVTRSGERRMLSAFAMTLGYSRACYVDIATEQSIGPFLRMHERAFAYLGGVPAEVLYDNCKTVVLGIDARGEVRWHPLFADFARYWGFVPRLCSPYRPQTKGKVENTIGYLRKNFLCGREAQDEEDLRQQAYVWTDTVANRRVHGTTGRRVNEAWEEEKPFLTPLGGRPAFPFVPTQVRRVSADAFVCFAGNRYSVPWQNAGKEVHVCAHDGRLEVWRSGVSLASHPLAAGKRQCIVQPAHHADIPLGPRGAGGYAGGKARIRVVEGAPEVQVAVRSLAVYEALAQCPDPPGVPGRHAQEAGS